MLDLDTIAAVYGKFEGTQDETLLNHLWRGISRGVRTLLATTDCGEPAISNFRRVDGSKFSTLESLITVKGQSVRCQLKIWNNDPSMTNGIPLNTYRICLKHFYKYCSILFCFHYNLLYCQRKIFRSQEGSISFVEVFQRNRSNYLSRSLT